MGGGRVWVGYVGYGVTVGQIPVKLEENAKERNPGVTHRNPGTEVDPTHTLSIN